MTNILDILSEYGNACRCIYQQGDSVEDAMDTIVEFCRQHGYDFSDDKAKELRSELYLCPLKKGIFQGAYVCSECPHSMKGGIYSYNSVCKLDRALLLSELLEEKNNGYSL